MNLYSIIVVEAKASIPEQSFSGGEIMLALGGIPAAETSGPWEQSHVNVVSGALQKWYKVAPFNVTSEHADQRRRVLEQFTEGDYRFTFEFSTGDDIDLSSFTEDTSALYETLRAALKDSDLEVTKFDSI